MGIYATIKSAPKHVDDQLKCWPEDGMPTYELGSTVPDVDGYCTYSVKYEGGDRYLWVFQGVITAVVAVRPQCGSPVFDKWGDQIRTDSDVTRPPRVTREQIEAVTDLPTFFTVHGHIEALDHYIDQLERWLVGYRENEG